MSEAQAKQLAYDWILYIKRNNPQNAALKVTATEGAETHWTQGGERFQEYWMEQARKKSEIN